MLGDSHDLLGLAVGEDCVVKLRDDERRILAFKYYPWSASVNSVVYLHPLDALMFYFLPGRTLPDAARRYAAAVDVSYAEALPYAETIFVTMAAAGFLTGHATAGTSSSLDSPDVWLKGNGLQSSSSARLQEMGAPLGRAGKPAVGKDPWWGGDSRAPA